MRSTSAVGQQNSGLSKRLAAGPVTAKKNSVTGSLNRKFLVTKASRANPTTFQDVVHRS